MIIVYHVHFIHQLMLKLIWFVQRLLIMSPISKPFIKQTSLSNQDFTHIKDKNIKINTTVCRNSNQHKFIEYSER